MPKNPQRGSTLIIFLFVITIIAVGTGAYYVGKRGGLKFNDIIPATSEIQSTKTTPTPSSDTQASTTPTAAGKAIYRYNTFSFSYPTSWELVDISTDKKFFLEKQLVGFDYGIALQKGDNILFIGIDKYNSQKEAGGIYFNDQDLQQHKAVTEQITIQSKTYYLQKADNKLKDYLSPSRETGVFALASLSEFIPHKITNEQGKVFDGYDDYIQNKNGYSYEFVKFTTADTKDFTTTTPADIQNEIKGILESITW